MMPVQLSAEQERRIQSFVDRGLYSSTEDVVDAAIAAVERHAVPGFEGTAEELEGLLLEGLNSGEPKAADAAFWNRLTEETDRMAAEHGARKLREG